MLDLADYTFGKTTREFFSYMTIGFLALFLDLACVYFFTEFFALHYLISVALAFTLAAILNYILQKMITFRNSSKKYLKQFLAFFLIGLVGLAINLSVVYLGVEYVGLWYMTAKLVATVLAFFWNFSANKLLTFRFL